MRPSDDPKLRMVEIANDRERIRRELEQKQREAQQPKKCPVYKQPCDVGCGENGSQVCLRVRNEVLSQRCDTDCGNCECRPIEIVEPKDDMTVYWVEDELVDPRTCELKLGDIVRIESNGQLGTVTYISKLAGLHHVALRGQMHTFGAYPREKLTLIGQAWQQDDQEVVEESEDIEGYVGRPLNPEKLVDDVMRQFDTGATRNNDSDALDYEGFLSPLVLQRFAEYMHKHRFQSDGQVRSSDNWQKGIPLDSYMKSGFRHFMDWWMEHRGLESREGLEDALCALLFNVQGYLHESLKANLQNPDAQDGPSE